MAIQQSDDSEHTNVRNWDLKLIKTGLRVDNVGYHAIHAALEEELVNQVLFGLWLNTVARKRQLERVLENVIQQFPHIFNSTLSTWTRKCLEALARKCNTNKRRRRPSANSQVPINSECHATWSDRLSPPPPQFIPPRPPSKCTTLANNHFGNTMVFVRWNIGNQSTIFRPLDLILEDKELKDISVADLWFDIFVKMLQEEMAYDKERDIIIYQCSNEDKVEIKTERAWRAALSEMFSRGSSRFTFDLEQDCARMHQETSMTFYYALECNNQLIEEQLVRTRFQKHNVNKDSVQSQWRGAGRRDGVCNEALLGHPKMACRIALKIAITYSVTICQQSIMCYSNNICATRNSTFSSLSPNFSVTFTLAFERSLLEPWSALQLWLLLTHPILQSPGE